MKSSLRIAVFFFITLFAGCAHIEEHNKEYPLTINTQLIGKHITIRVNSGEKGQITEAQVTVIDDDIRRIVIDEPLNSEGIVRFRVPSMATRLTVTVIDSDGDKGKKRLFGDELRENEGRSVRWYY